jgi:ABC-type sugar transport system ATPase subunit
MLPSGEQQMLAMGRGLMARPRLLLDEPSMGLAPILVEEIFANIGQLNRDQQTTILLVEQNALAPWTASDHARVAGLGSFATLVMAGTQQGSAPGAGTPQARPRSATITVGASRNAERHGHSSAYRPDPVVASSRASVDGR